MKRIGLTQRVVIDPDHGERRDCLDQQWTSLFEHLGLQPVPVPNHLTVPQEWLKAERLDGFVLTGGNDLSDLPAAVRPAAERDLTEKAVLEHAKERCLPVLGVCRGMQLLNVAAGGSLVKIEGHVATRHRLSLNRDESLFSSHGEVNSFHDWGIAAADLADSLVVGAQADDDTIEAFRHRTLRWVGIMWHPEREKPFSPADLELFATLFKASP